LQISGVAAAKSSLARQRRAIKAKKLSKRNGVFVGSAHTRDLLKKVDQNFTTKVCANKAVNQNF
jgi:copper chaperone CopZ